MFLIFLLVWVVLCGHVSVQTAVQGVLVSGLLTLFCYRVLGYSLSKDRFFFRHLGREMRYFAYLVKEIVHAALVIMRIIYTGGREMEPRLIYFHNELRTPAASSILANSITLTAGTITVAIRGGQFCVHTLDRPLAEGIEDSSFAQRLRQMEE